MRIYKTDNVVFKFTGNIERLLKGLCTNTLDSPHSAFLDFSGRIIVVFGQKIIDEDSMLIIFRRQFKVRVINHLERYVLLSKTRIEETDYLVYFDLDNLYILNTGELSIPQKAGKLILCKGVIANAVTEEEYTLFRLQNKLPLQGMDYDNEMLLNLGDTSIVSFTKGCYLGQEIIARVHNLGKPPKRLVVKYEDNCIPDERKIMTSRFIDKSGRTLGFVFERNV